MIFVIIGLVWLGGCDQTAKTYSVGGTASGAVKGVVLLNSTLAKKSMVDIGGGGTYDRSECEPEIFIPAVPMATTLAKTWTKNGVEYTSATEKLTLKKEGKFAFETPHADETDYNVTITSTPKGVECTLKNNMGTVHAKAVSTIELNCVRPTKTDAEEEVVPNKPPVAEAGDDKIVGVGETVTITGIGTDEDGTVVAYEWKEGTTVLATTARFDYVTPDGVGDHTLTLTVTDDEGATDTDTMMVYVAERPTADDGAKYIVEETEYCSIDVEAQFNLTGYDPMGGNLTFIQVTDPNYGKVTVNTDGTGTFVLETEADRNDCLKKEENSFTFKVNNGHLDSEPATFSLETHDET
jgi:hypothetical protein